MGPPILNPAIDAVRRNYSATLSNVRGSMPAVPDYGLTQTFGQQLPGQSQLANSRYLARSIMGPQQSMVSTFKTRAPVSQILGAQPPLPLEPQTQFQRSLMAGEPIDMRSIREDRMMMGAARDFGFAQEQIKGENEALRAEVHRLKKIEAGWFPGNNEEQTKVTIVNNYQSQINQYVEEINNLKSNLQLLESENLNMREQLRAAVANPELSRKLRDLSLNIDRLTAENRALRATASSSALEAERTYAQQLDVLRRQKSDLELELRNLQAQLSQKNELVSRVGIEERQKSNSIIDSHRLNNQKLQDEIAFLKTEVARLSAAPQVPLNDPRINSLNEQIRSLRDQLGSANAELERRNSLVFQLESKASAAPRIQTVVDDAAVRDRDNLLAQYKAKWDEFAAENSRLKSQIAANMDEMQRLKLQNTSSVVAASSAVSVKRDQALIDALRLEAQTAKDDSAHYRQECQRLRDQLRELSQKVSRTEIRREVIVDKTGDYAARLSSSPEPRVISTTVRPAASETYATTGYRTQSYSIPATRSYYNPVTYSTRTNYSPSYEYSSYQTQPATYTSYTAAPTYTTTGQTYTTTTAPTYTTTTTLPTYTTTTTSPTYAADTVQTIQSGSYYGSAEQPVITETTMPLADAGRIVLPKNEVVGADQTAAAVGNVFTEKTSETISFGRS